jgi:hypothetical protein
MAVAAIALERTSPIILSWDGRLDWPIDPRLALQVVIRAMQLAIELFASLAKFIHALTQASRQFRQFFGAEEHKHRHENNNQIGAAEVPEAECERMHVNHLD